jgi:hypothetical protein
MSSTPVDDQPPKEDMSNRPEVSIVVSDGRGDRYLNILERNKLLDPNDVVLAK